LKKETPGALNTLLSVISEVSRFMQSVMPEFFYRASSKETWIPAKSGAERHGALALTFGNDIF
jgi:hypothetical protein